MRLPNDWAARCFGPHRRGINKRQSGYLLRESISFARASDGCCQKRHAYRSEMSLRATPESRIANQLPVDLVWDCHSGTYIHPKMG
jgi:hypothetical protein